MHKENIKVEKRNTEEQKIDKVREQSTEKK